MRIATATASGIAMLLGVAIGIAWAQGTGAATPAAPKGDPAKITVSVQAYDMKRLQSEPAVPDNVYRGRALWLQRCAYCHDGVGQPTYKTIGPWLGAETVQTRGETAMRAVIAAGTPRMPGFRYTLKPPQLDDLFAFLKTISSDQKPTAAQFSGIPTDRANTGE